VFQGEQKRMRRLLVIGQSKDKKTVSVKDKTAQKADYRAAARALVS
jgi:hypothetical protein